MRKKRGYNRDTPVELVRDYKLFAIACEGKKREPEYFKTFRHLSNKIAVDIVDEVVSDEELFSKNVNKSAPKWVLDRAVYYIDKEGLSDEDELWFVIDVDRWSEEQIRELASYCEQHDNWNIVISNPCFEVWLYFHRKENIEISKSFKCKEFKNEISTFDEGGYNYLEFILSFKSAVENAKKADSDPNHFMPKLKETKVYKLGEALIREAGNNSFEEFINVTIPNLLDKKKKHWLL